MCLIEEVVSYEQLSRIHGPELQLGMTSMLLLNCLFEVLCDCLRSSCDFGGMIIGECVGR